jgi:hypothetical protein
MTVQHNTDMARKAIAIELGYKPPLVDPIKKTQFHNGVSSYREPPR